MARFDVYRFGTAYALDVQANLIAEFGTRIVAPLLPEGAVPQPVTRMHPVFEIAGRPHVLATHLLASVPKAGLGRPIYSLSMHQDEITQALDVLLTGF